jgi:hypothetical protein
MAKGKSKTKTEPQPEAKFTVLWKNGDSEIRDDLRFSEEHLANTYLASMNRKKLFGNGSSVTEYTGEVVPIGK